MMEDWLSVRIGMGMKSCLKSFPRRMSQIPSADAIDPATNSDSMDEWATSPCFFDAQEIGPPLNRKIHPVVDFQSFMSPAKSASVKLAI